MKTIRRRKGFLMIMVLAVMAVMGVMTGVMAFTGRSLLMDAGRQRADLATQNLQASALAWVQLHRKELSPDQPVSLPTATLGVSEGVLTVTLQEKDLVRVETAFEQGALKFHEAGVFRLTSP